MSCGPRRRSVPLTIPLKSLPSEREVVGEVSVCWPWGILCKLFAILSDLHEAETKGHFSLYRDSCLITSLQSRAMHMWSELFGAKWSGKSKGKGGRRKIPKLLLMLLVLPVYLTRLVIPSFVGVIMTQMIYVSVWVGERDYSKQNTNINNFTFSIFSTENLICSLRWKNGKTPVVFPLVLCI